MTKTRFVADLPLSVKHGSGNAYSWHECRCDVCSKAQGERNRLYRLRNVERFRSQRRAEYAANPERFKTIAVARYRRRRLILDRYKLLKGCFVCGYRTSALALEFHHREPSEKSFNISERLSSAWETIKAEVKKCEVVCANCHAILERTSEWRS